MIFSVTTYCAKSNGFVTYQPLEKKKKKIFTVILFPGPHKV